MSEYPANEQWRKGAGGKCEQCRRHGYCKTQCKENRLMVQRFMLNALIEGAKARKAKAAETKAE